MRSLNTSAAANFWALVLSGVKGSSAFSIGCGRSQEWSQSLRNTSIMEPWKDSDFPKSNFASLFPRHKIRSDYTWSVLKTDTPYSSQ